MRLPIPFAVVMSTSVASASLQLTKEMMEITRHAAVLSGLVYSSNPDGSAYDEFQVFKDEPDQAIYAKKDGYCYGIFRGTTLTGEDWGQNLDPEDEDICNHANQCCKARRGFVDACKTNYKDAFEARLNACAATCTNKDECVILGGHSQGGAAALVSAVSCAALNPYTITFGMPPAVHDCNLIKSDRVYRFINTIVDKEQLIGNPDLEYDPVSFAPSFGCKDQGHLIVLPPPGATTVAYYGVDTDTTQTLSMNINIGTDAHKMSKGDFGYLQKIEAIISAKTFPVPSDGFPEGTVCIQNDNCKSDRCDSYKCKQPKPACSDCDEDSDCDSGKCLWGSCAADSGKMPNGCFCVSGGDCESRRCEGTFKWRCQAKLPAGEDCNEDSDCISGKCVGWWSPECEDGRGSGFIRAGPTKSEKL